MNELASQAGPDESNAAPKPSRLTRLRNVLRARDWLGFGIEIAVVTLGVLLAFEIEQWGQQRDQEEQERQFLERLYSEYRRGIDELRSVNESHSIVMRDIRLAFAARSDPARLKAYSGQVNMGCGGGYLRTAPFNDTAFQELISSGRLSIVRDAGLRSEIRDLTTQQASLKDRAALGGQWARDQDRLLYPYYRVELAPDGSTRCFVDWASLFADARGTTAAARTYQMHQLVRQGRADLLELTKVVRAHIGCKLGKPECRRLS